MQQGLARLEAEQGREAEEQRPPAAKADATEQQADDRVRLAAMDREEVGRRRPDGEVRRVRSTRRHLAALVADAHHPVAATWTRQLPLRREGEAARLRRAEVLRHPA